jgi:hypothetical protein
MPGGAARGCIGAGKLAAGGTRKRRTTSAGQRSVIEVSSLLNVRAVMHSEEETHLLEEVYAVLVLAGCMERRGRIKWSAT